VASDPTARSPAGARSARRGRGRAPGTLGLGGRHGACAAPDGAGPRRDSAAAARRAPLVRRPCGAPLRPGSAARRSGAADGPQTARARARIASRVPLPLCRRLLLRGGDQRAAAARASLSTHSARGGGVPAAAAAPQARGRGGHQAEDPTDGGGHEDDERERPLGRPEQPVDLDILRVGGDLGDQKAEGGQAKQEETPAPCAAARVAQPLAAAVLRVRADGLRGHVGVVPAAHRSQTPQRAQRRDSRAERPQAGIPWAGDTRRRAGVSCAARGTDM